MTANTRQSSFRAESSSQCVRYMSCVFSNGVLGLATYDDELEEIKAFQGWEEGREPTAFHVLKLALLRCAPAIVVIASNACSPLLAALNNAAPLPGISPPEIRFEKNSFFQTDTALGLLKCVEIATMPQKMRSEDRMHWLNARVNLAATQQIRAVGALLHILQTEGTELSIRDISEMHLDGSVDVQLSASMNRSFFIFQEDNHPSVVGIGKAKEGFSLFGIMNRCLTQTGKRLLHAWFLRPLLNLDMIRDRLDTIEVLKQRSDILEILRAPLRHVKDIPSILKTLRCHQAANKISSLQHLVVSIDAVYQLKRLVSDLGSGSVYQYSNDSAAWTASWSELSIVEKFSQHVSPTLKHCRQMIARVVDFELDDDQMCIARHVSTELDGLKDTYTQLPEILTDVVERELKRIPRYLSRGLVRNLWSIVYVPQVGYLIQVLGSPLGAEILDILEDYQLAFESTADDGSMICYYTGQCTENLNDQFGDILHKIQDLESSLCAELICRVLEVKIDLIQSAYVVAELDCYISLALCANEGNYCRPEVTETNDIIIRSGRHPLTELTVETYIANDTTLSTATGTVQLITGPNASGKSCYMKQVAMLVYLSHIGAFVPALSCKVGLTDRIFARSTFMNDLAQIGAMIKHATPRSFLLIDEFGKGTLTSNGVGLLCAVIEYWSSQDPCPKIIACTHFSEVFSTGLTERCPKLQYLTMEVMTETGSLNSQSHTLLYNLIPGRVEGSYGIRCAELCGMDSEVVSRAKAILRHKDCRESVTEWSRAHEATYILWMQLLMSEEISDALLERVRRVSSDNAF